MARILVTGSANGIGQMTARLLVENGHRVVLHARSSERAEDALKVLPGAEMALAGDLASISGTRQLAEHAKLSGPFDAVIHNAGVMPRTRNTTTDGLTEVFAVNVLAPYILTCLLPVADRFIYVSSGAHRKACAHFQDLHWQSRPWDGRGAYAESKLYGLLLTFAVSRRWPDVLANAVSPGWVPTQMGGPNAPDDLAEAAPTQAWLAVSRSPAAMVSGGHFYHYEAGAAAESAYREDLQDHLLEVCARLSGVSFP